MSAIKYVITWLGTKPYFVRGRVYKKVICLRILNLEIFFFLKTMLMLDPEGLKHEGKGGSWRENCSLCSRRVEWGGVELKAEWRWHFVASIRGGESVSPSLYDSY